MLVGSSGVLEAERLGGVAEGPEGHDEGRIDLVFYSKWYLVIPRVQVEKAKEFTPNHRVHDHINMWQAEGIL